MASSLPGRVLITGSAGRLGQAAVAGLAAWEGGVRGFDRGATPGLADSVCGSIADAGDLRRAMTGVETVIHLAATPDDDDFVESLVPNNIIGLHHVLEESLRAGVRRVLLASTGQVNWWQQSEGPWPIRPEDAPTPKRWYAATKVFMEAAGLALSRSSPLRVLVVRLGWCPRTPAQAAEIAASPLARDTYLSPGDAARFFGRAVATADWPPYAVVFAASRPESVERFAAEPARRILGWTPQDQWPAGIDAAWLATGAPAA